MNLLAWTSATCISCFCYTCISYLLPHYKLPLHSAASNTTYFLISQLLWSLGLVQLGRLAQGLSESCSQAAGWLGCSHLKAPVWCDVLPRSFSGCWQDPTIPHRLLDCGPQFLVGCWLEDTLSFWLCELLQLTACREKPASRESASKMEVIVFTIYSRKWHPLPFSIFCSWKASHYVQLTLKERFLLLSGQ